MNVKFGFLRLAIGSAALALAGGMTACTSDSNDPGAMSGAGGGTAVGTGAGGTVGGLGGGGGTAPPGTACASPITIAATSPGIADFDGYDGVSDLGKWSAPLGNDSASGVFAGPFGYGDRSNGLPETFDVVAGQSTKYALRIADTLAQNYGGGMGTWLSACINATRFSGLSFWVRGNLPTNQSTLTLSMSDTMSSTPAMAGGAIGTCAGTTSTDCVHPTFSFPVTDTWTQIQVPWSSFTPGNAVGTTVIPDGHDITQIQFGVGLVWAANTAGVYAPTPAPYELVIDTLSFY